MADAPSLYPGTYLVDAPSLYPGAYMVDVPKHMGMNSTVTCPILRCIVKIPCPLSSLTQNIEYDITTAVIKICRF